MTGVVVVCPGIEDRLSTAAAKTSKSDGDMNFTCELDATSGLKATTYLITALAVEFGQLQMRFSYRNNPGSKPFFRA
jgi:hypothetical protein